MTIARWQTGDIYIGITAFYITLLKTGDYAVSKGGAMAMGHYERLGRFANIQDAIACFGRCTARYSSTLSH